MSLSERIKAIFRKKNKRHCEETLYDDIPDLEAETGECEESESVSLRPAEEDGAEENGESVSEDMEEADEETGEEAEEEEWDPKEEDFDFDIDDPELTEWVFRELEKEAESEKAEAEEAESEEAEAEAGGTEETEPDPEADAAKDAEEAQEDEKEAEENEEELPPAKPEYRIQNENEQIIFDLLAHTGTAKKEIHSGDELYDAVAFACHKSKIDIVPPAKKEEKEGFTSIREIAANSHFIIREIRLKRNWHKKNGGVMVGFLKEEQRPVALYYGRLGRYVLYDPKEQTTKRVNAKTARTFSRQAYTLYAAFPNEKMTLKQMLLFGLKRTKATDRIRYLTFTLLVVLVGLLIPDFQKALFDRLIPMASYDGIRQTGYVILAFLIGNFFFAISKKLSEFRACFHMKTALYAAVCERIFHMPEKVLRNYKTTELADCVLGTDRLLKTAGKGMNASFVAFLSLIYLVQMYSLSPKLTGQAFVFTVLWVGVIVLLTGKLSKRERQTILLSDEAKSRRKECFSNREKVKAFGMQERVLHHCLTAYAKEQKNRMASDQIRKRVDLLAKGAGSIAAAFLYWCMIAGHETFQTGWFIAFLSSFGIFLASMTEFGVSMRELLLLKPLLNRIRPVLETAGEYGYDPKEADRTGNGMETADMPGGDLEVSELDFAYEEDAVLFQKFSLHVKEGAFIGITGLSGSGKTTLMKLLLGMEKPEGGKIYYGTSDLEQMDLWEFRRKCAIVLQSDRLIEGSIRENICLSNPEASDAEMLALTDRLQLTDEIEDLPNGFDTMVCDDTRVLSAAQRQKILIARALLKQPSMIFFDEATMDLDDESQDLVLEYLRRFTGTRFIISNRISAIAYCDRILMMDRGKIVESGSYRALMKKKGLFYKMAIRQMV